MLCQGEMRSQQQHMLADAKQLIGHLGHGLGQGRLLAEAGLCHPAPEHGVGHERERREEGPRSHRLEGQLPTLDPERVTADAQSEHQNRRRRGLLEVEGLEQIDRHRNGAQEQSGDEGAALAAPETPGCHHQQRSRQQGKGSAGVQNVGGEQMTDGQQAVGRPGEQG